MNLLLLEWQNEGLNLWTVSSDTTALVAGTASYTLSADKLDIIDAVIRTGTGTNQRDLTMTRMSINTYANRTNKNQQGRPVRYWVEQADTGITIHLWPVPDVSTYSMFHYFMQRIEDTGDPANNTADIPVRFIPALTAGLAFKVAMKTKGSENRVEPLSLYYDKLWNKAADSARDKSSVFLRPGRRR
jgi:hypothetical protein